MLSGSGITREVSVPINLGRQLVLPPITTAFIISAWIKQRGISEVQIEAMRKEIDPVGLMPYDTSTNLLYFCFLVPALSGIEAEWIAREEIARSLSIGVCLRQLMEWYIDVSVHHKSGRFSGFETQIYCTTIDQGNTLYTQVREPISNSDGKIFSKGKRVSSFPGRPLAH